MEKMKNALNWFEIPAADINRARKFYESIFDIHLEEMALPNGLKMALFPAEEHTIGGALCQHKDFYTPGHQGPLVYLNGNPDLSVILGRVAPHGGKILLGKTQINPEYGYMALFEDSEGNRMALHSNG